MKSYSWLNLDASAVGTIRGDRIQIGPSFTCRYWRTKNRCAVLQCGCGNTQVVRLYKAKCSGTCYGCRKSNRTHGLSKIPEFHVWKTMKSRCHNKNSHAYPRYGGRGIVVCDRWRASFADFYADMGPRPTGRHCIDRIDNDGNYEPGNCRWVTNQENCCNTSRNRILTVSGESKTLSQWSRETGVSQGTIIARIERGWSVESAVLKPARNTRKRRGEIMEAVRALCKVSGSVD